MKNKNSGLLDHDLRELLTKGGTSFLLRIFGQAFGFFLAFIIANYFGADTLGDYVLAIIVLRVFTVFAKLGFDTTAVRFISSFASQNKWQSIKLLKNKIIMLLIFSSVCCSVILYFSSSYISNLINANQFQIQTIAFFILPMAFFILHYQSLRGLKKIASYSFFYWMSQSIFSLIVIFLFLTSFKSFFYKEDGIFSTSHIPIYAYLISLILTSIISLITYKLYINKKSIDIDKENIEYVSINKILIISLPLMFAQSGQMIMSWTDKIMLGALESPIVSAGILTSSEQVGIYHIAFKLSMFASITLMAVNSIAAPKFSELYAKDDMQALKKVVQQSTKIIFWTSIPLILIFFSFPKYFLSLFGSEFIIGINAFIFLSFGKLINAFSGSVGNLLQMTGQQVIFMKILFIGAILNISLNYFLIPIWGINGAAIASMSSIIFWNLSMVIFIKKEYGFLTLYIPFISK